jgi:hypothetical protein
MMHADNNTELFTHEQTTQMTSANSGEPENKQLSDFVDKVCDPCGFVPANLDEALAHKKKMKLLKAQDVEAAKLMESGNGGACGVDPVVGIPGDETKNDDDDHAVDSMLAKFDLDCCPQPNNVNNTKGIAAQEDKQVSEEEFLKSEALAEDDRERSLANIAAKMNDIDLETAAEDTSDDQINDDYGDIARSGGKMQQPWYKIPAYAALIVLCGAFSIAIIVMAILLLVKN